MNAKLTIALLAAMLAVPVLSFAATKDATKYDCRKTVAVRSVKSRQGKDRVIYREKACPHRDKLAAGQCETSWLWGMRCKS